MLKYFLGVVVLLFVSCGNKESVLLPKADQSIVKEVLDLSPIYIFFRKIEKDTLVEVNRKNSIISTNWILNIDKRLPLRLVIPEVIKLQEKKLGDSAHKNESAQNYYSYADSIVKNLAFLPFTKVFYKLEKPKHGVEVYFDKNNKLRVNSIEVSKTDLENYLNKNFPNKSINYCFDKNMSFDKYIKIKIAVNSMQWKSISNQEYIY